jgi:hypothetical protein
MIALAPAVLVGLGGCGSAGRMGRMGSARPMMTQAREGRQRRRDVREDDAPALRAGRDDEHAAADEAGDQRGDHEPGPADPGRAGARDQHDGGLAEDLGPAGGCRSTRGMHSGGAMATTAELTAHVQADHAVAERKYLTLTTAHHTGAITIGRLLDPARTGLERPAAGQGRRGQPAGGDRHHEQASAPLMIPAARRGDLVAGPPGRGPL